MLEKHLLLEILQNYIQPGTQQKKFTCWQVFLKVFTNIEGIAIDDFKEHLSVAASVFV